MSSSFSNIDTRSPLIKSNNSDNASQASSPCQSPLARSPGKRSLAFFGGPAAAEKHSQHDAAYFGCSPQQ